MISNINRNFSTGLSMGSPVTSSIERFIWSPVYYLMLLQNNVTEKTEISKQASRPITGRLAPLLNLLLYESKMITL